MGTRYLNEYRFFDPDPVVRKTAFELYQTVKNLPIISPHGHVEASLLFYNDPFPDPAELIIIPDHYVYRMLYSQGIALERLGIPSVDGTEVETDHRKIWQIFAENFYLFRGTPTGIWLQHVFSELFGIEERLNSRNAMLFYDVIQEKLKTEEFLPRSLFKKFNIEVLTTTNSPSDDLKFHRSLRSVDLGGKVIPCFRPDVLFEISKDQWKKAVAELSNQSRIEITCYRDFIKAIEARREYFKTNGCVSTDQGIESAHAHKLSEREAEEIFSRALRGEVSAEDERRFVANMIMEMARMSSEDGLVMQIHVGAMRNHNLEIYKRFGADKGGDIPVRVEFTKNLHELLNSFGNNPNFTLVVFTLDESTYARELAPLAGHYPAMKLGAPWWFHDSIEGMTRFREQVTETSGFYNTVGFTDDSRAFLSIPARYDLSRRMDANFLARLVARHILDIDEAEQVIRDLAYQLPKKVYGL